jgi:hypothetical protein
MEAYRFLVRKPKGLDVIRRIILKYIVQRHGEC